MAYNFKDFDAQFPDDAACLEFIFKARFANHICEQRNFYAPPKPKDELRSLIIAGYVTAVLAPCVGLVIGIILLFKNRVGSGLACIGLSFLMAAFIWSMNLVFS